MFFDKKHLLQIATLVFLAVCLCSCSLMPSYPEFFPWKEYSDMDLEGPYVIEMEGGGGRLLYYGALHSNSLDDEQMRDIENQWKSFRPSVAYCEGGIWPLAHNREDAIQRYGEQGLVRFLADRDGVPVRTFDPSLKNQARFLTRTYSPGQVKSYFVLLHVIIARRQRETFDPQSCIEYALLSCSELPFSNCAPYTSEDFEIMMNDYYPDFRNWPRVPPTFFHERRRGGFLADIHLSLGHFRDDVMLSHLIGEMKKGKRVFAVAGRAHVAVQESTLRSAFAD